MDLGNILTNAYDNRYSLIELNKLYAYCEKNSAQFKTSELDYICFALNIYGAEAIKKDLNTLNNTLEKMQHKNKDFNPEKHDRKKAITVKNPYAEWIADGSKKIEVRSKSTKYRGELVICSSKKPFKGTPKNGLQTKGILLDGCTLAVVELYDVIPLKGLTKEQRLETRIPNFSEKTTGYAWLLRNPKRLVEYPVSGQLGIWNLVLDKLEFVEYGGRKVKEMDVNNYKAPVYDKKAVRLGAVVLIAIFALVVFAAVTIFQAVFN